MKKILTILIGLLLFTTILPAVTTSAFSIDKSVDESQMDDSSLDPECLCGWLFGKISNPVKYTNEYGTKRISFYAEDVYFIGRAYGFGQGPRQFRLENKEYDLLWGLRWGYWGIVTPFCLIGRYNGI